MPFGETYKLRSWFGLLEKEAQDLVAQSYELYDREERLKSSLHDYSFVVFPMAKAYEGFLKQFLYKVGFIDRAQYEHRQFRIGRSLNPDVSFRHKDEYWLYDDVAGLCGEQTARALWDTWIDARNHLFHYFPDTRYSVDLKQAKELLERMGQMMDLALESAGSAKITRHNLPHWQTGI